MWRFSVLNIWFIVLTEVTDARYIPGSRVLTNDSNTEEPSDVYYDHPRLVLFIFGTIGVGGVLRILIRVLNCVIPYRLLIIFFGVVLGVVSRYVPTVALYTSAAHISPCHLLTTCVPILLFKTAFCLDSHVFLRSWTQIFCLVLPGLFINATILGLIMTMLLGYKDWFFNLSLVFGIICSPIYAAEIVNLLREIRYTKYLGAVLEGEGIIEDGAAIITLEIILGVIYNAITEWYHVITVFLRFALGGLAVGYIFAKLMRFVTSVVYNDMVNLLTLSVVSVFMCFCTASFVLSVSGVIAVVVLGVMSSIERTSLSTEMEESLLYFWDMLANIVITIVFLMAGIVIAEQVLEGYSMQEYSLAVVTYIVAVVCRFISFIVLAPIISRLGYGLTARNMTIAVWSGIKGPVPFILALTVRHYSKLDTLGNQLLVHVTVLVVLTLLINATTMPFLLKLLGLSEISMSRKVNMNSCMRHLQNRRERIISMLKMDRFLSDANWGVVYTATIPKHPYELSIGDSDDEDENFLGYRITTCPECQKEILDEPTAKEMVEMIREARMRILKARKISYTRQYENGMLSKEGIRILTQAVEVAMDTREALIELDGLHKYFRRQGTLYRLRVMLDSFISDKPASSKKPPRKYWRRTAYHMVMHPLFDIIICIIILLNIIPIVMEIAWSPKSGTLLRYTFTLTNTLFFIVYLLECLLKIYGYSWIYICKHGVKTYFSSYWNVVDFIILCAYTVDLAIDYLDLFYVHFDKGSSSAATITSAIKLIRVIRLLRLIRLCKMWHPTVVKCIDSFIDMHLAFAYDIGKGFVTGEEEVCEMLPQIIDNKTIREACRARMEADRLEVTKELGVVQKDRPWIAITVKTRQAIRSTLNSMSEAILELKVSGWVDDAEYSMLMDSLEERLKYVRTKVRSVQPSPPKVMFKEIPWMSNDESISEFLFDNVITKVYDQGDTICVDGEMSDGIYIIVTGILKLSYIPKTYTLDRLTEYGALPVIDYITTARFDERINDYIVSGNSIGELSVLTNRPYDCTITADTTCQTYILTHDVVKQAFERSSDPLTGLEVRMWKSISIRLATSILMEIPAYQSSTLEKIRFHLEAAFIPNFSSYKIFGVNDMMQDVILIEGVASDYNTGDFYTAPCYIPRTVQKIVLPRSSHMNFETKIETKLLIIPASKVDEFDVMEKGDVFEMVSVTSSKCLQHSIQSKSSIKSKRKKKQQITLNKGHRRPRREQSGTSWSQSVTFSTNLVTSETTVPDETELRNISMSEVISEVTSWKNSTERFSLANRGSHAFVDELMSMTSGPSNVQRRRRREPVSRANLFNKAAKRYGGKQRPRYMEEDSDSGMEDPTGISKSLKSTKVHKQKGTPDQRSEEIEEEVGTLKEIYIAKEERNYSNSGRGVTDSKRQQPQERQNNEGRKSQEEIRKPKTEDAEESKAPPSDAP